MLEMPKTRKPAARWQRFGEAVRTRGFNPFRGSGGVSRRQRKDEVATMVAPGVRMEEAQTTQPPVRERTRGCKKAIDRDNSYDGATILEDFRV